MHPRIYYLCCIIIIRNKTTGPTTSSSPQTPKPAEESSCWETSMPQLISNYWPSTVSGPSSPPLQDCSTWRFQQNRRTWCSRCSTSRTRKSRPTSSSPTRPSNKVFTFRCRSQERISARALRSRHLTRKLYHMQSATLVIAYYMKKYDSIFSNALKYVRKIRPNVCPNLGFELQLKKYQ